MQVEYLVWLVAGIGVGLFIAMAILTLFAVGERRHLRRWGKRAAAPAPDHQTEREPTGVRTTPEPVAAEPSIERFVPAVPERETKQSAEPIPAAERPQLDIEGLFERAFQSSLKPDAQAAEPPKQTNS